jgi:hypothetical protein
MIWDGKMLSKERIVDAQIGAARQLKIGYLSRGHTAGGATRDLRSRR